MNSLSSSKHSLEEEPTLSGKNPTSMLTILPFASPPFSLVRGTPILRQPLGLSPNFGLLTDASNVARETQRSVMVYMDRCIKILRKFMLENEVIENLTGFGSHVRSCLRIPNRNHLKLGIPSNQNFAAILSGDSVAGVVVGNGIMNFLNIYNTLLVVRLVLTWFPNAPPAVVSPLSTICDPYLNIFRGIIPPLGGTLDLSPILAFLVLNAFQSTASALPAELPPTEVNSTGIPCHTTATQKKWMSRVDAAKKSSRFDNQL